MAVAKYRKKPVVIEAIQYTRESRDEVLEFLGVRGYGTQIGDYGERYEIEEIRIKTLEGTVRCPIRHWVIKGVKGEFYPCAPEIFEQTYEEVEPWDE